MKKIALIVFVLLQISPELQAQSGTQQIVLHTTSDYSCSSVNFPTISLLNSQKYPNDELTDYSWTKDGSFHSNGTSVVANGPGEYCLTIIDNANQISNTKCITILPYRCDSVIDASFLYYMWAPSVSPYFVALYGDSTTFDSCYTHEWFVLVKDPLSRNTYTQIYYTTMDSGFVNMSFDFVKGYKIKHVVTGPCGSFEYTRTLNPIDKVRNDDGGSDSGFEGRLGNNKNLSEQLFVYPNPTNGIVYIPPSFSTSDYRVVNIHGQIILEGNNSSSLDLTEFSDGVYSVVFIKNDGKIHQQKVVKH